MANEVNRSEEASYALSPAQLELLEVLLEPDAPYPWNNADPESENYRRSRTRVCRGLAGK